MRQSLTRRSLLMSAAPALLMPRHMASARMGGAPAVIGVACTNIAYISSNPSLVGPPYNIPMTITGPGTYCLTADQSFDASVDTVVPNVTIDGNGHAINGTFNIKRYSGTGSTYVSSGIVIKNLVLGGGGDFYGNASVTQTNPLALTFQDCRTITFGGQLFHGSNILVKNCLFNYGSDASYDDRAFLSSDDTCDWCVIDNCVFGDCWDVGLEGCANSWNHVTIKNCTSILASTAGIGAWYGPSCNASGTIFELYNCTFTNNAVHYGFRFGHNNGYSLQTSDAACNATWGSQGNSFSGNTYV